MTDDTTLSPTRKEVTIDQIRERSGPGTLGTNTGEATDIGMPAPIASGTMTQAFVSEWLFSHFGEPWLETGRLSVKFVDIVMPGDTLLIDGTVTERDGGVEVDIECRVADGDETVIVGTASIDTD